MKNKGFVSIFFILVFSIFSLSINNNYIQINNITNKYTNLIIESNFLNNTKNNHILNIKKIIELELNNSQENPDLLKENINLKIINYNKNNLNNKLYIYNTINKKEEEINLSKLNEITKVIIFKTNQKTLVKKYIITNSSEKNKYLKIKIQSKNLITNYLFPKDFTITKYVYL